MADDPNTPSPTDDQMGQAKGYISGMRTLGSGTMSGRGDLDDAAAKTKGVSDKMRPDAPEDAVPQAKGGGLQEFLFQFLKSNPDLAREMSTRMNAVIHGQRLQGMKTQDRMPQNQYPKPFDPAAPTGPPVGPQSSTPPAQPQQPTQMAGDVIPIPGEKSMGQGESPDAAGYALGQQTQPGIIPVPNDILRSWYERARARQG